jgi:hypothetical protein
VILRQIGKWLNAGVLEAGSVSFADSGTPQGGVISPLLANIYLHTVLDRWLVDEVRPKCHGNVELVRYADDFVIVCRAESDARAIFKALPQRFETYGLTLHPEKTRLVCFDQPRGGNKHEAMSFDFLGFTHTWMKSQKGTWVLFQVTARKRLTKSLDAVRTWLAQHLLELLAVQHRMLSAKLQGHYAYFGLPGNALGFQRFRSEVRREWRKALSRRSWASRVFWTRFHAIEQHFRLPYGHVRPPARCTP